MNSFIGWIGGKRALRNEILQRMPSGIGRYIEVFGGAGWVLFGREPSSKVMEVFNDYDAELVNIYRCIRKEDRQCNTTLCQLTVNVRIVRFNVQALLYLYGKSIRFESALVMSSSTGHCMACLSISAKTSRTVCREQ